MRCSDLTEEQQLNFLPCMHLAACMSLPVFLDVIWMCTMHCSDLTEEQQLNFLPRMHLAACMCLPVFLDVHHALQ
jgi:hypothetical protein